MSKTKRVILINITGDAAEFPEVPSSDQMRRAVGGDIEYVRVLDRIVGEIGIYTTMVVNATGLLDGLPRNKIATNIYQRNVRLAFPGTADPFKAADDAWRAQFPANATVADLTPARALARGYKSDPWIAGKVVLFEGYTVEEADKAITEADKRAERAAQ